MGSIDSIKSILTKHALDVLCKKYYIHDTVHPELPGRNDRIQNSPSVKSAFIADFLILPIIGTPFSISCRCTYVLSNKSVPTVRYCSCQGIDIMADEEIHAIIIEQTKRIRNKRKAIDGAGGSGLPPKKLREDHGTFGVSASVGGTFVVVLQSLLEGSTLAAKVGVMAATIVPFVTSSVTLTPEREGGGYTDSITGLNLRTQKAGSTAPDLAVLITAAATMIVADTSTLVLRVGRKSGVREARHIIFRDSASSTVAEANVAGPSQPVGKELLAGSFYVSQDMDHRTLRPRKPLGNKLNDLKKRNVALKGKVAALESATASKDAELASSNSQAAKVTQDLSNLQLSYDELSVKASSLEFEKDKLIDQVSALETTCSGLRDEMIGYKMFKEQNEAVQDAQVKLPSDKVAKLDADLMRMVLYLDEEFYPRYLTTIAGRRWILNHGLRLMVMKCLQSPEYLAALGGDIGRAIDKGIQDGLAADIDHRKARRVLAKVDAYNPAAEHIRCTSGRFATTTLSTTFVEAIFVLRLPKDEAPPSSIVFEKEELDTTPEHTSAP
nr:hypothetical protein [Tanacetum cinerariifolium]